MQSNRHTRGFIVCVEQGHWIGENIVVGDSGFKFEQKILILRIVDCFLDIITGEVSDCFKGFP